MKVAIACDHGGFSLKTRVLELIKRIGAEPIDLGAVAYVQTDDYPDFARAAGQAVQRGEADKAVVLCGSGVGACIAANKLRGIHASVCHDVYSAHQGVEHDDMNVLCLGSRIIGEQLAEDLVQAFVEARFSGEARHQRRLEKVHAMEAACGQRPSG